MRSCVLIITADLQATANLFLEIAGWGPNSYTVPLSATGRDPVTHYGLHAWVQQSFENMMTAAQNTGLIPQELADGGMKQSDFALVLSNLIVSFRLDIGSHWSEILGINGLQMIIPDEEMV